MTDHRGSRPDDEWERSTREGLDRFLRENKDHKDDERQAPDASGTSAPSSHLDALFARLRPEPPEPEPPLATPTVSVPVDDDAETQAAESGTSAERSWMRLNLGEILIVTLCVIGFAEVGWIGLRVLKAPTGAARQADPNNAQTPAPTPTPPSTPSPAVAPHAKPAPPQPAKQQTKAPSSQAPAGRSTVVAATPEAKPVPTSGWLTIDTPVPVDILERGRRVGNSWSGRVRLTTGRHELDIVNRTLAVDSRKTVDIASGGIASLVIDVPPGLVNINAVPWASVQIDGASVGDTPLANLQLTAGPHEVVFTHPQLGVHRVTITVASGKLLKLSTDLRKSK
jgi:hypothetical protein